MRTITKTKAGFLSGALIIALFVTAFALIGARPVQAYAADELLTTAASSSSGAITPGDYYIQSQVSGTLMLDVTGASKAKGANVQVYTSNKTKAQVWRIASAGDGTYTIKNVNSGKYLDVSGGKAADYANVQQWSKNGTAAQRWKFKKTGTGYQIVSALNSKYVLDTTISKAVAGTNVIIYKNIKSTDQKWWLIPAKPSVTSERVIDDGAYELEFAEAPDYVVDVQNGWYDSKANVQIYTRNNTLAQRWYIRWESDGYYSIRSVNSAKALEVADSNPAARTNIWVNSAKSTAAQRWAISKNSDGTYTIVSKLNGLALEIAGAKADNGTNVRTNALARGASQRLNLKSQGGILPDGTFNLFTLLAPSKMLAEFDDATTKAGEQAQLGLSDNVMEERFYLRNVSGNVYTIQAAHSGLYLADDGGKVVQKKRASSDTQRWTAGFNGNGIVFTNKSTGKRIAISGGKAKVGAKLVTAKAASKNAQRFRLVSTRLVPDGLYEVSNTASGRLLDVAGGSTLDAANVQVFDRNKTAAQGWSIAYVDDGYYKIINEGSNKALDVVGASKDAKANVRQYTYNKTAAQMWMPKMRTDGSIVFVNKSSFMYLEAAGKKNGSNVYQDPKSSTALQGWHLKATTPRSISGNTELDGYLRTIIQQNNGNLKSCFEWVTKNIKQVDHVNDVVLPKGIIDNQVTINYALYALRNKTADGYYFASLMKWLAKGCGYTAEARSGQVPAATGGLAKHGWTEVVSGGVTYVCDADLALEIGPTIDRWYMFPYSKSPIQYTF